MTTDRYQHQFDPGEDAMFEFTDRMTDGGLVPTNDLEATALRVQQSLRSPEPQSPVMPHHLKHNLWEDIMNATTTAPVSSGSLRHQRAGSPSPFTDGNYPATRRPAIGTFATFAIVAAVLIAGLWQGGAFRGQLPGGFGDEPIDFAAIPFLGQEDDGPDIVASPAASGECPPYEEEVLTTESGSDLNIDPAGMRELLAVCISAFTWPDDVQPDVAKIQARFPDGNWVTSIVAPRSTLAGLNLCAWQHVWIVAMQEGDTGAAAEIKPILVDVLTSEATYQSQAEYDRNLETVYADDVDGLAALAIGCYPMDWAKIPVNAPGGTGTRDVLPGTPAAPSECDLTRDMPVIPDGDLLDTPITYLKLADGILSLVCDGSSTNLVTQVENVTQLDYPGILRVSFEPLDLGTRRQGLLNVATGELIMYGFVPENIGYDAMHPAGSPWFIAPDVDDTTRWVLTDLRTFESRDITNDIGAGSPDLTTELLADYSPQSGTLLVGLGQGVQQNDATPATLNMITLGSIDGEITRIDARPDAGLLARNIGIDATGTVVFVYSRPESGSGSHLDVFDLANGTQPVQESNVGLANQGALWTAERTTLVYTTSNRVVAYATTTGLTSDLFVAAEGDIFGELTYGPEDLRVVLPQYTPSIDEDGDEDADLVAYLMVDVRTGETQTINGIIVAPNVSPWSNYQRFVATIPSYDAQPVTVTILDLETMQPVGETITFPVGTDPGRLLGPDAIGSTDDGTTMVIAFTPNNPSLITAIDTGSRLTTLFDAGEQPRFEASSLNLSGDGTWLGAQPDGSSSSTAALVDLSSGEPNIVEIDGIDNSAYFSFVEGIDD